MCPRLTVYILTDFGFNFSVDNQIPILRSILKLIVFCSYIVLRLFLILGSDDVHEVTTKLQTDLDTHKSQADSFKEKSDVKFTMLAVKLSNTVLDLVLKKSY